ncbi:hypothetical protein PLICRDRAFT_45943 [Plicaturopsis crispa FD-325 SS-3]|uniref:F-box domain-containing protein n=1 Tax=Plicaturopsis crispa FD-325 SS-3 TaxID=944288 RepID=A0A0C9SRD3_PLICR|nr:hypothetical protein PLICRDRAFT_45943 [Plicaturopsis crispa FD-325 SS-3]
MDQADAYSDDEAVVASLHSEAKKLETIEEYLLKQLGEVQHTRGSVISRAGNLINRRTYVSRLPDEILPRVFAYGDPTYTLESLPSHVLASHVSQRWRQVTLHDSSLWACIWRGQRTKGYPLGLLEAHLERSRTYPLHIICGDESDAFFQALVAHVDRWSSFGDSNLGDGYSRALLRLADLCAPALRSLSLTASVGRNLSRTILADGAPVLSSLIVSGGLLSEVHISFTSLTVLRIIEGGTLGVIQDALAHLPSLQTLVFGQFGSFEDRRDAPVNMPSLTTLEIGWAMSNDEPDSLPVLFSAIQTPRLEALILSYVDDAQVEPFEAWLHSGSSPRFPCLHSLTLEHVPATSKLVRAFPGVKHVVLYTNPHNDCCSVLETWLQPAAGDSGDPWPMLQSIAIKARYHIQPYDPSHFVASRSAAGRPLQKLLMDLRVLPGEDVIRGLKDHVQFEELLPDV